MDVLYYLIIARSVTYAQRMQKVLDRAGIVSRVFRAPRELAESGCAYALQISAKNLRPALQALHREKLNPVRIFLFHRGQYQEIQPGFVQNPSDRPGQNPGFSPPGPPDRPGQNPGFPPGPSDRPGQNPGFPPPKPSDRPGFMPGLPGISARPWGRQSEEGKS